MFLSFVRVVFYWALLSLVVVSTGGCENQQALSGKGGSASPATSNQAGASEKVTLKVVDRQGFDDVLGQYRGKVVLVDFWATWCTNCLKMFPHTLEMGHKYADKDLVVLSMCVRESDSERESEATVLEMLNDLESEIPNLTNVIYDDEDVFDIYDIGATLPHYRIYDRQGKLVRRFDNDDTDKSFTHEDVEAAVRTALGL